MDHYVPEGRAGGLGPVGESHPPARKLHPLAFGLERIGLVTAALWSVVRRLEAQKHPLGATARALRNLVLPIALLVLLGIHVFGWSPDGTALQILETVLWIAVIAVSLSLVKNTAFTQHEGGQYQTRFPKLLLDILRLLLVAVGACIVIADVWGAPLGSLLTAVGEIGRAHV